MFLLVRSRENVRNEEVKPSTASAGHLDLKSFFK